MKQLQLELNKRLLIVESENANEFFIMKNIQVGTYYMICKGDELIEDIAKGFSVIVRNSHNEQGFIDYKCEQDEIVYDPGFITAVHSFISAIESKGYHWGENPVKYPNKNAFSKTENFLEKEDEWQYAESRTFNPEKCIIFEIVKP